MAYGIELILGFKYTKFERVCKALELPFPDLLEEDEDRPTVEQFDDLAIPLNSRLREAHHKACLDMGWTPIDTKARSSKKRIGYTEEGRYTKFVTPLGLREFSPFDINIFFDQDEMGEGLEHAALGVALSGRCFPTFLDWRDPHGTLSPIFFDETLYGEIGIARLRIQEVCPIFSEAILMVKEIHY